MSNRLVSALLTAACFASLLTAIGCGDVQRSIEPQAGAASVAVAGEEASIASLDATRATTAAEEEGDLLWHDHATPIKSATIITQPGDYRLVADLDVADGDAIVVRASDVRLWLGDYRLRGPGNKQGRAIVLDGVQRVSASGGHIERFGFGAVLLGSSQCRVHGLDIQGGDETADPANGNPPQIGIMMVNSAMNRVRGNSMRGINLGIFVRGGGSYENSIRNNVVVGAQHGLLGICYNPAPGGDPAGPQHDRVSGNTLARFGTGITASAQSAQNYFTGNSIGYFDVAYVDLNGTNVFERNRTRQLKR